MINEFYKEFKVKDYIESQKLNISSKIDCSLGTNPFLDDNMIQKYVKYASSLSNQYAVNGYDNLKNVLINFYSNILSKNIGKNNISFGSGTMGIIRNLCEFLIEQNTKALGIAPQFTRFISEVELKKGIYEYYKLDKKYNYRFVVDDFLKMIDKQYSLIYIDNPNNPTGQVIDIQDIEKIAKKANEYGIIVIIDEAYGDYMQMKNSSISLVRKI